MSPTKPSSTSGWEPLSPEHLQRLLPQYEIAGILGRGGMGAVYEGRQAKLNRRVAIKVLPETFTQGEDELNFAKRFEQEAQAMANLDHPAIISVYDFGETGEGQLYFVMEFVDGMDIHQYMRAHGGKLPQEQALAIVAHVLDALDYAHGHGIVHRDIKPANILLNREGRVKIADFGLAKKFGETAGDSVPALTMTNVAVGTPDFVAPEALDPDAKPDHRADLYAVGVMLYQLLTGKIPRGNFRTPSDLEPEIDPRLDEIVSKAMAADPDHRYSSAMEVRADLDAVLSQPMTRVEAGMQSEAAPAAVPVTSSVKGGGESPATTRRSPGGGAKAVKPAQKPAEAPKSRGTLILGLSVVAALAIGFGGYWMVGRDSDATVPSATASQKETSMGGAEVADTESPTLQRTPAQAPATTLPVPERVKAAAPTVPAAQAFPPGQWVKLDGSPHLNGLAVTPDGWLSPLASPFPLSDINGSNHGIRWVTKMVSPLSGNDAHFLSVRMRSPTADGTSAYQALISAPRKSLTLRYDSLEGKNATVLKSLAESLEDGGQFSIEFAVIGDKLACRMNGNLLAVVTDPNLKSGSPAFRNIYPVRDIEVINLDGLPESEAFELIGVDPNGNDLRAPTVTKADAPEVPQQVPVPTLPATPASTPPSMPKTPAAPAAPSPLAALPGLKTRLDGFHTARRTQIGELAKQYLGGLESRLNQAADAGDLKLATAFGEERTSVETLQKALAAPSADPLADASDPALTTLPALPKASPPALVALRQTWTVESEKIRATLDAALQQSLQTLESELTKARDFENASAVLAWRESLAAPVAVASRTETAPAAAPAPAVPAPAPAATGASADPSRATKDAPFENSLGMKFVPVPDTGILLCIHETRKGDYAKFAEGNPKVQDKWKNPTEQGVPVGEGDDHPVVSVNWNDAKAFCDWLSQKEGRTYRLPTDREWSVAAGFAREEKEGLTPEELHNQPIQQYPWGTEWPPPKRAGNYGDTALKEKLPDRVIVEGYTDGFATTAPVMSFRADRLGLFDIGGNISEWCGDWWNAEQKLKVNRGSDWGTRHGPAFFLSHRGSLGPSYGFPYIGFRCVLVISAGNAAP